MDCGAINCDFYDPPPPPSQGHSSFVTHVDWSTDSQFLVTNSGDYEILFCTSSVPRLHFEALQTAAEDGDKVFLLVSGEASCGKHVTNMDTVRNIEWATSTCTLSFSTFGGLKKRSFKSDVCLLLLHLSPKLNVLMLF